MLYSINECTLVDDKVKGIGGHFVTESHKNSDKITVGPLTISRLQIKISTVVWGPIVKMAADSLNFIIYCFKWFSCFLSKFTSLKELVIPLDTSPEHLSHVIESMLY